MLSRFSVFLRVSNIIAGQEKLSIKEAKMTPAKTYNKTQNPNKGLSVIACEC